MVELQEFELADIRKRGLKVCSLHFKDEAYSCPAENRHDLGARLLWNAVPDRELTLPRLVRDADMHSEVSEDIADNTYPPRLTRFDAMEPELCRDGTGPVQAIVQQAAPAAQIITLGASKLQDKKQANLIFRQKRTIKTLLQQLQAAKAKHSAAAGKTARMLASKYKQMRSSRYNMRWTSQEMAEAIRLHHKSPTAYRYLLKDWQLALPSESALKRRTAQFFKSPGVCALSIQALRQCLAAKPSCERKATLCFDGMSLSKCIRYDQHKDEIIGLDGRFSSGSDDMRPINEAVVAVLRSVCGNWKQAIAYYPVSKNLGQAGFKDAIQQCLEAAHQANAEIIALVADQESTQWACLSKLVSCSDPYLIHPVTAHQVYVVIDPPHCLKNTRNALMSNNIRFGNRIAKWEHVLSFYEADCKQELRLAPKLSELHLNLRLGKKMKVSLAANVLSHSVASGIRAMVQRGHMPVDSLQTADFIDQMNSIFDLVNSCHNSKHSRPITAKNIDDHVEQFEKAKEFIASWSFIPLSGRKEKMSMKFNLGWLITLSSLQMLATRLLVPGSDVKFLHLRRFTQDHVEVRYLC
jgi:hypothetical protein